MLILCYCRYLKAEKQEEESYAVAKVMRKKLRDDQNREDEEKEVCSVPFHHQFNLVAVVDATSSR
jgi:hypothetical protein